MSRKMLFAVVLGFVILTMVVPVYAQGETGTGGGKSEWLPLASGFGMALAAAGCGYAQSKALAAACEGVSRNPGATDTIRIFIFLGLAFIEFLALLTFVVIMLLLYF